MVVVLFGGGVRREAAAILLIWSQERLLSSCLVSERFAVIILIWHRSEMILSFFLGCREKTAVAQSLGCRETAGFSDFGIKRDCCHTVSGLEEVATYIFF